MSKIGKLPVAISSKVKVDLSGNTLEVVGPLGALKETFPTDIIIEYVDNNIVVKIRNITKRGKALWGLVRSLIVNMVQGVTTGFSEILEITGVGYRSAMDGGILSLSLGFSHEIKYIAPAGITIKCLKPTQIEISGISKQLVGQVAAEIRSLRKPEPYKGKGIRYGTEIVRRKEGKKK